MFGVVGFAYFVFTLPRSHSVFPRPMFRPMQKQPGLSAAVGLFAKFFCSGEKMDPRRFQQCGNGEILFCFPFLSKSHISCSYSLATAARVRDLRRGRVVGLRPIDEAVVVEQRSTPRDDRRWR